jgi:hypothetical protein
LTSPAWRTRSARPAPPPAHPAEPSRRHQGWTRPGMAAADISHVGTCSAPPGNGRRGTGGLAARGSRESGARSRTQQHPKRTGEAHRRDCGSQSHGTTTRNRPEPTGVGQPAKHAGY